MTEPRMPREFWIDITCEIGDALEAEIHTEKPECWDKDLDPEISVHVIEYSAYEALQKMFQQSNVAIEHRLNELAQDAENALMAVRSEREQNAQLQSQHHQLAREFNELKSKYENLLKAFSQRGNYSPHD